MKSFTAKEFSRCPAKVYEAAREDGSVEVTHDRFKGKFVITHEIGVLSAMLEKLDDFDRAALGCAMSNLVDNGDGIIRFRRPYPYDKVRETTNGLELAQQAFQARRRLVDEGLVPPDQLTEEEKLYLKNKKAPD